MTDLAFYQYQCHYPLITYLSIYFEFQESYHILLTSDFVSPTEENFNILDANGNGILTWSEWKSFHNLKSKVPNNGVPGLRAFSELKNPADSGEKLRILEPR